MIKLVTLGRRGNRACRQDLDKFKIYFNFGTLFVTPYSGYIIVIYISSRQFSISKQIVDLSRDKNRFLMSSEYLDHQEINNRTIINYWSVRYCSEYLFISFCFQGKDNLYLMDLVFGGISW